MYEGTNSWESVAASSDSSRNRPTHQRGPPSKSPETTAAHRPELRPRDETVQVPGECRDRRHDANPAESSAAALGYHHRSHRQAQTAGSARRFRSRPERTALACDRSLSDSVAPTGQAAVTVETTV